MDWLVTIIQFFLRKSLIIILTTTFLNHNTNEKLKFFLHTDIWMCKKYGKQIAQEGVHYMINFTAQKEIQNESIHTWKHRDKYVEDYMAQNYDYIYNRTYFAKTMYSDFAKEIKNNLRKYLKNKQEMIKEKRDDKKSIRNRLWDSDNL